MSWRAREYVVAAILCILVPCLAWIAVDQVDVDARPVIRYGAPAIGGAP